MDTPSPQVTLHAASGADAGLFANLMQLYCYDLSPVFTQFEMGEDGRFPYARLPLYFSEPERRFPFLIRLDGRIAGFVLVSRGSPASADPQALDVAEFFVLRRFRRSGVGRRAAALLWDRLPGTWTVRVAEVNRVVLPFWRGTIEAYLGAEAGETFQPMEPYGWWWFSFESRGA